MYQEQIVISPDSNSIRVQFNLKNTRKIVRFISTEFSADQVQRWAEKMLPTYAARYN